MYVHASHADDFMLLIGALVGAAMTTLWCDFRHRKTRQLRFPEDVVGDTPFFLAWREVERRLRR